MHANPRTMSIRPVLIVCGWILGVLIPSFAPGDDTPKLGKGTPSGEVFGGSGGESFRDRAEGKLGSVAIRSGSYVDSLRCTWLEGDKKNVGDLHGGDGGEETVIQLEAGEYFTKVSGVLFKQDETTVVGSITLKTNKRTLGPYGMTTEGEKYEIEAPKDQEVCGFRGRSGSYLDSIGIVVRSIPKP